MNNIEIKSVVNLRKAAWILKELNANVDMKTELSVDAFLNPDDYREKLHVLTNKAQAEFMDMYKLCMAIANLRDIIKAANYENGIDEELSDLAFQHSRLRLIKACRASMRGSIYTDEEVSRMIARQEKREQIDSYFGSSDVSVIDPVMDQYLTTEENSAKKRIRLIQDTLTDLNMKITIELPNDVIDWIVKLDLMD